MGFANLVGTCCMREQSRASQGRRILSFGIMLYNFLIKSLSKMSFQHCKFYTFCLSSTYNYVIELLIISQHVKCKYMKRILFRQKYENSKKQSKLVGVSQLLAHVRLVHRDDASQSPLPRLSRSFLAYTAVCALRIWTNFTLNLPFSSAARVWNNFTLKLRIKE